VGKSLRWALRRRGLLSREISTDIECDSNTKSSAIAIRIKLIEIGYGVEQCTLEFTIRIYTPSQVSEINPGDHVRFIRAVQLLHVAIHPCSSIHMYDPKQADIAILHSLHIAPAGEGTSGERAQNHRDLGAASVCFRT
jgi:hypothetical protein